MDECILDDLLECSVCLERLDTSSKVLPCQHTFCKKCLEEILRTHSELRCPECRILVETRIEDLPPNVLLMRILEGLGSAGRRTILRNNTNNLQPNVKSSSSPQQTGQQVIQSPPQTPSPSSQTTVYQNLPYARANYDYLSKEPGDLTFRKGDIILLRKKIDNNWCLGECNGNHGVFPLSYVQVVVPFPTQIVPQCKALFDFKIFQDQEDGCLVFHKGDLITVMRRVDENWAEGRLGDKIGIFPLAFVELNTVAKSLIKNYPIENQAGPSRVTPPAPGSREDTSSTANPLPQSQPVSLVGLPPAVSDSSSTSLTSPSSTSSSTTINTTSSSSHSSPSSPPPPPPAPNKRHSFGTTVLHNGTKFNEVFYALSQHRTLTQCFRCTEDFQQNRLKQKYYVFQHCQLVRHGSQRYRRVNSSDIAPIPGPQLQHSSLQLPASSSYRLVCTQSNIPNLLEEYVALYPYKPQKGDELELKRGAVYTVTERCQDGWFKGTAARGQKAGVFPGNYVAPAKHIFCRSLPALQAQVKGFYRNGGNTLAGSGSRNGTPPIEPRGLVTYTKPSTNTISSTTNQTGTVSSQTTSPFKNYGMWNWQYRTFAIKVHLPQCCELHIPSTSSFRNSHFSVTCHIFLAKALSCQISTRLGCPCQISTRLGYPAKSAAQVNDSQSAVAVPSNVAIAAVPKLTEKIQSRDKKEKSTVSLMRRLANIKKSKSPPPTPYSLDNPVFEDLSILTPQHVHIRSGSCPNQLLTSASLETSHRIFSPTSSHRSKPRERPSIARIAPRMSTGSSPPSGVEHRKCNSMDNQTMATSQDINSMILQDRIPFRCIVPYPPNSEYELELRLGDIIFVHKKREDGWYKGTQQRTGRTGLFPASFVQSF
uniref:RING-type E3 ubiquitin transferase n=1 Tax=Rhodnius prolixus TaxID=13249 RepID=T1HKK2_RHOPR